MSSHILRPIIDMICSVLPCSSASDADVLWQYINAYATHPRQQMYQRKILVSTFAGEHCTFGQSNLEQAWHYAVKSKQTPPVHFVPSFFVDPNIFPRMTETDGQFNVPLFPMISFQGNLTFTY